MKVNLLTPLDALYKQKVDLQAKADALEDALAIHLKYLQKNIFPLAGEAATDALLAKVPPVAGVVAKILWQQVRKRFF